MAELFRKYQKMDFAYDEILELFLNYNSHKTRMRRDQLTKKLKEFDKCELEFKKVLVNEYLRPTEETMWKNKD